MSAIYRVVAAGLLATACGSACAQIQPAKQSSVGSIANGYDGENPRAAAAQANALGVTNTVAWEPESVDRLSDLLTQGHASGDARVYEFQRTHPGFSANPDFSHGLAVGGDFLFQTAARYGLSAAVGVNTQHVVAPLSPSGPDLYADYSEDHLTSITQAYVQYHGHGVRLRGGRQLIDTPFAAPAMYTMMPRAYYGITATLMPLKWLQVENPKQFNLFVGRVTKYESRFSDNFIRGNKYFRDRDPDGFLAVGANYKSPYAHSGHEVDARAWYYRFYDIGDLYFFDGQDVLTHIGKIVHPFAGIQLARETESGDALLGDVNAEFYGLKLGLKYSSGSIAIVGTYAPVHHGTYENGGLAVPYARLQDNGGVFTATMNNGNMDIGPGFGYGLKAKQEFLNGDLSTYLNCIRLNAHYGFNSNAHYNTGTTTNGVYGYPDGGTPVADQHQQSIGIGAKLDLTYFSSKLEGMYVQDQMNYQTYAHAPHDYTENRLRLVYQFR